MIDARGVTFVASIGLRHLVSAAKTLARRGGSIKLVNANPAVADVITSAGLAQMLPIEPSA